VRRLINITNLPNDADALAELRTNLIDALLRSLPLTVEQAVRGVEVATAGWRVIAWPVLPTDGGRVGYRLVAYPPAVPGDR
jgi:hypothetical protein